jgi:DNA integrity scanning protein DisA with diadenylate cyclase activity
MAYLFTKKLPLADGAIIIKGMGLMISHGAQF